MCQMEPHQLRDKACDLAPAGWTKAAAYAEQIDDPWYACQAFAWCGRFAPAAESTSFIDRAFRQAEAGKDAYQQLAATAWPLRALVERNTIGLSGNSIALQDWPRRFNRLRAGHRHACLFTKLSRALHPSWEG